MSFDYESLLAAFEPFVRNAVEDEHDRLSTWIDDHLAQLDGDLSSWASEVSDEETTPVEALDTFTTQLLQWGSKLVDLPAPLEMPKLFERWETRHQHLIAELPEEVTLEMDPSHYRRLRRGDSLKVLLWRIRFAIYLLFRGKKRGPAVRTVDIHSFLRMHLGTLVVDTLFEHWLERIVHVTENIRPLHLTTVERLRGFLPGEDADEEHAAAIRRLHHRLLVRETMENASNLSSAEEDLDVVVETILIRMAYLWNFAGTAIVPRKSWSNIRWNRKARHYKRLFKRSTHRWIQVLLLRGDEWGKDLDLLRLEIRSQRVREQFSNDIPERIERGTVPDFGHMRGRLRDARDTLRQIGDYDGLRAFLARDAKSTIEEMRRQYLTNIADRLLDTKLEAVPDETLAQVKTALDAITPIRHLITKLDTNRPIPRYRFSELPLQKTISLDIFERLRRGLFRFSQLTTGSLSEMSARITNIEHVLQFAHETATNILGRKRDVAPVDKAKKELDNGYKRALQQVDELQEELRKLGRTTVDAMGTRLHRFQLGVRELIDNDRAFAVQARAFKASAQRGVAHSGRMFVSSIVNGLKWLGSGLATIGGWIRGAVTDIRRLSGLEMPTSTPDPKLLKLLTEAREQMENLPLVYQRIFRLHPLDDERFFVSRESELGEMARQREVWRSGQVASTAIIGERGSGRTSLIKIALHRHFRGDTVRWIDLDKTIVDLPSFSHHFSRALKMGRSNDINAIEQKLLEGDPMVIVFEDIHNLFLRTIDGFEALERFLLLMARTSSKVFWIVTCTKYSWSYLDKVVGIGGHLQWVINLSDFSVEDITRSLMKRSRASGFKTQFRPSGRVARTRAYRRLRNDEDRQRYLLGQFFQSLSRFSAGNITVAILFWLHSIRGNEGGVLQLAPDITFDASFIRTFHPDDIFTLQAFAIHEFLNDEQHALVFNQHSEVSRSQLSRLRNMGVLEESIGGYRIHPFLFRPVVNVLKERNMLP